MPSSFSFIVRSSPFGWADRSASKGRNTSVQSCLLSPIDELPVTQNWNCYLANDTCHCGRSWRPCSEGSRVGERRPTALRRRREGGRVPNCLADYGCGYLLSITSSPWQCICSRSGSREWGRPHATARDSRVITTLTHAHETRSNGRPPCCVHTKGALRILQFSSPSASRSHGCTRCDSRRSGAFCG